MKRLVIAALLLCLSSFALTGCYTTGKVAGDTVQGVESGAKDLKKGYEDGKKN
ncbi:MAG: hypothetical protein KJ720_01645 [Proteobacteria bacterium]|nr:hypothetical protein [Pseudomonadota bacterium]MBU1449453.1 hypothetical protein [Pseudomonadota bacterium]MBU2469554.1 hypothetical protein [Pseudomonadota bacterium]MBU2517067.1 hypothetical protein [Pseudomonadota bacterium]